MRKLWALLFVIPALGLAACSSDKADETSEMKEPAAITEQSLAGTWALTGAAGPDGVVENLPAGELTVEDGRIGFSAGCNEIGAEVAVVDGQITTDKGITTAMFCEGDLGLVDDIASQTLGDVQSATLTGEGELTLVGPGGTLTFQRQ